MGSDEREQLVQDFANSVIAQDKAPSAEEGNRHAFARSKAFDQLVAFGDEGREALSSLFRHEDPHVRCMAAAFLIRYKTDEATAVLEELAADRGFVSFCAKQTLKNWANGSWELDPE